MIPKLVPTLAHNILLLKAIIEGLIFEHPKNM